MQVRDYVIRRLIKLPLVIIAVTIGVFLLSRLGGSPIAIYIEHEMTPERDRGPRGALRPQRSAAGAVPALDLGRAARRPGLVGRLGGTRLRGAAEPASSRRWSWPPLGAVIAIALGIGLGTFAGARHNKFADHVTRVFTVSGASLPLFWFALLMLILFYLIIPIVPLGRFDEAI